MTKQVQQAQNSQNAGQVPCANQLAVMVTVAAAGPARKRHALRLVGSVSAIAMTAMLGAAPARALPPPYAQVNFDLVPSDSSLTGFVVNGSQQQNTASAILATLTGATGSSTVTGNSAAPLPSAATVSGNELAAFATGNAQTNGVDLATIGSSGSANGIAVLAEQSNTYTNSGDPTFTTPTTINSSVTDSNLVNEFTNATNGDTLAASDNLITGQTTGNIAMSSVTGVVPVTYTDEATPGTTDFDDGSGTATGNIVVGTSQYNNGIEDEVGSYSTLNSNNIGLQIDSGDTGPGQYLALSTSQTGNEISADFLGNSANNDIGVSLTSGTLTGAPTLYGSLAVINQQANQLGDVVGNSAASGAANTNASVYTSIYQNGVGNAPITLDGGATTQNDNIISASAIGNSAVGAGGVGPGNEITLGINLVGDTTGQANGDLDGVATGADLTLSNLQQGGGTELEAASTGDYIGTYIQNAIGSSIGVAGNSITSNAAENLASNSIDTASGVGINLISGLAALSNAQAGYGNDVMTNTQFDSIDASVTGTDGEDSGSTNTTVSVANDSIAATSNTNQAANVISLAASTINAGPLGDVAGTAGAEAESLSGSEVGAGISLNNEQLAEGASTANVGPSYIGAHAGGPTLSNDSISVTNPTFTSDAFSNNAANNITLAGSQGVSGAVGLLSDQLQIGEGAVAFGEDNNAEVSLASAGEDNDITASSGVLGGTSMSTEATENYASNVLAVSGGQLSNGSGGATGLAAISDDGPYNASEAAADLVLNNLQDNPAGPAFALYGEDEATVTANADGGGITNSTFTVSGPATAPTMQALAIGNEAVNALSAIANTVLTDTEGLLNAQLNVSGANATGEDTVIAANVNTDDTAGDVSGSSITVGSGAVGGSAGNLVRSLAYANQAANTLSASAGTVDLVAAIDGLQGSVIPLTAPYDTLGEDGTGVAAAYGLLNDQVASGEDFAIGEDTEIGAFIGNNTINPSVTDVTASTAGNAQVASAFANQADNSATLSAGNLTADGYYPVADVTSLQSSVSGTDAEIDDPEIEAFTTQVLGDGTVTGSTLGVTGNSAITQAETNQASNSLATAGGNIVDTSFGTPLTGLSVDTGMGDVANANLAFTVQNVQNSEGVVTSGQVGTNALLSVGGAVDLSTLSAGDNIFQSTAYSNNADNTLGFGTSDSPVDTLNSSAGVQNVQTTDAATDVSLGAPGTPAVPGTPDVVVGAVPYTVATGNNSGVVSNSGGTLTVTGQPLVFDVSGLSGSALTDFEDLFSGGSAGSGTYTLTAGVYTLNDSTAFSDGTLYYTSGSAINDQDTTSFTEPGTDGTPATPASPSVVISAAGDITDSTLTALSNAFNATAIGNAAVNAVTIAANALYGGAGITAGTANASVNGTVTTALADYAVSNVQAVDADTSAETNGEVAINPTDTSAITGSTLSVSDNTELAKAEGNIGTNTLSLAATTTEGDGEDSVSPTAALVSNQSDTAAVSAAAGSVGDSTTIGGIVTAPGAITDSTLTMDDNSTKALAIVNNVTNLLSAAATTLDTADTTLTNAVADVLLGVPTATADYALDNVQSATGGIVTTTAVTQVVNADSTSNSTTGLVDSAVDISGNSTTADADGNIASNTLNMSAANSTATGALVSSQTSGDTITANGLATVGFALNGGAAPEDAAASNATISVTGNSLNVQAIGDQAVNALNVSTGATYGSQVGASADNTQVSATYAVLNAQDNSGEITATGASGSQYAVALNSGGATSPVSATTIAVTYNTMGVAAFGNSATNTATVTSLNAGNASVALQNTQTNTGAIASSVTGSVIGADVGMPGVSTSTITVGDNSIVSSAVGNTATNEIVH